jgi:hypothetical protein
MNKVQKAQVSDTTEDEACTAVDYKKILLKISQP